MIRALVSLFFAYEPQEAIYDCSHPSVRYAQHLANRNKKAYILVKNFIGGLDILPSEKVDRGVFHVCCVTPHYDRHEPTRQMPWYNDNFYTQQDQIKQEKADAELVRYLGH